MTLTDWTEISSIGESVATVLAIIVAGCWTYRLFVKNRAAFPRASIALTTFLLANTDRGRILRVEIAVKNDGDVLLPIQSLECRLLQIFPVVGKVGQRLESGEPLVLEKQQHVAWPMIDNREWSFSARQAEIEPGELQTFCADFLVDQEVSRVEVYCHLANALKKSKMGWTTTSFVDLSAMGEPMSTASQREERQLPRTHAPEQAPKKHQVPPTRQPERVPTPAPSPPPKK